MNMQYPIMEMLPKASSSMNGVKKSFLEIKDSSSQFRSVLGKTLDSWKTAENHGKTGKSCKPEMKVYRDVVRNLRHESSVKRMAGQPQRGMKEQEARPLQEKVEKEVKVEAVMEGLAQVLAIHTNDLRKFLEKLDVKPEDMLDAKTAAQAVEKIGLFAGLTVEQKDALMTLMTAANQQMVKIQQEIPKTEEQITAAQKQVEASEELKTIQVKESQEQKPVVEVIRIIEPAKEFTGVMNQLKLKLQEIADKLQNNPQAALEDISAEMKAFLQTEDLKTETQASHAKEENSTGKASAVSASEDTNTVQPLQAKDERPSLREEAGKESNKDEKAGADGSTKLQATGAKDTEQQMQKPGIDSTTAVGAISASSEWKTAGVETAKLHKESSPIPRNEILNQMVEKAKVVLSAEKSEMVMDLKPDSLGKLALKVVTERGMVVAQFVAENQQVKEIIEANMQVLKDALEKQGLSVQSFSVSVGQDNARSFQRENRFAAGQKGTQARPEAAGTVKVSEAMASIQQRSNPYNWSSNTINLTA
jgi:flagellar hook-length control protein FliK